MLPYDCLSLLRKRFYHFEQIQQEMLTNSMSGALLSTLLQIYVENERRKQTIPVSQASRAIQDGGQDGEPIQLYSLVRPHAKGTTQLVCY